MKGWLASLALVGLTSAALAQLTGNEFPTPKGGNWPSPLTTMGCLDVDGNAIPASNSCASGFPVTGSISASVGGFIPSVTGARMTPLAVTTSDSSGTLPTGVTVVVSNVGSNPMYCNLNGVAATTSDQLIAASSWFAFTKPPAITTLHCIATGSSTTANAVGGAGLPTGAGGGGAGITTGTAGSPSASVVTVQGIGGATGVPVSAASLPLPTLAATSTKQSDGSQKTQVVDGSGNVIASTANALNIFSLAQAGGGTDPGIAFSVQGTAGATPIPINLLDGTGNAIASVSGAIKIYMDGCSTSACNANITLADAIAAATYAAATPQVGVGLLWNGTTYDRQKEGGVLGAAMVGGTAASGTAVAGNPVYLGLRAATASPTAVTDGQAVGAMGDKYGRLVSTNQAPVDLWQAPTSPAGKTDGTTITIIAASGSGSLSEYMTWLSVGRSDTGTTAITADVTDGTLTYHFTIPNSGGGGGREVVLNAQPIKFAANHAVTCAASTGVTTFYCYAQSYNAP